MKVKGQYTMLNTKQKEFVDYASKKFGTNTLTVSQLKEANKHFGCKYAPQWLIKMPILKLVNPYLNSLVRMIQ